MQLQVYFKKSISANSKVFEKGSTENNKIRGLFKALVGFSSTFQASFNFLGLFKKALYISSPFKPVLTLSKTEYLFLPDHRILGTL